MRLLSSSWSSSSGTFSSWLSFFCLSFIRKLVVKCCTF
jgi:hypothetical protein